jgi:TonB family protein
MVSTSAFGQAPAPPADPPVEALARPISPGSVALLLPYGNQPAVVERLKQALAGARPEVRAVAARMAFTTRHQALAPALTAALEREQSPVAGAEIVRALTLIRGAAADAAIRAALPRFDSRAARAWTDTLVRVRPADLWPQLADLPNATALGQPLFDHAVAQPEAASAAFANLRATPGLQPALVAILVQAQRALKLPPWPIVAAGLDTPGPPRQAAAMLLFSVQVNDRELPPEAASVLRDLPASADLAWMPVWAELVRRRVEPTTPPRPLVEQIAKIDAATFPTDLRSDSVTAYFDKAEVAAFRRVVGPGWAAPEPPKVVVPAPVKRAATGEALAANEPPKVVTRLARAMSVDLLRDLVTLLKCSPAPGQVARIDVQYKPTGQVRSVSRLVDGPSGCLRLASIVAALEVAPGHERVGDDRVDRLIVGLRPSDLTCERYPPALEALPSRPGAHLTVPKKTRDVAPVYPDEALQKRIQGVVVVEADITTSGCIAEATVLRSVPGLDDAAVAAVSVWEYETARLDGKKVPVIMTVTVNFTLQR